MLKELGEKLEKEKEEKEKIIRINKKQKKKMDRLKKDKKLFGKVLLDKVEREFEEYQKTGDFDEETLDKVEKYQEFPEESSKDSSVFDVATSRESVDTYSDSELGLDFIEDVSMVDYDYSKLKVIKILNVEGGNY